MIFVTCQQFALAASLPWSIILFIINGTGQLSNVFPEQFPKLSAWLWNTQWYTKLTYASCWPICGAWHRFFLHVLAWDRNCSPQFGRTVRSMSSSPEIGQACHVSPVSPTSLCLLQWNGWRAEGLRAQLYNVNRSHIHKITESFTVHVQLIFVQQCCLISFSFNSSLIFSKLHFSISTSLYLHYR